MEVTFSKTICPCLRKVIGQVQLQEQTQEVRLPEAMPDIGRVLDSWGQVLIRSKEWRADAMTISGGVMTWVLYVPEGDAQVQSVEAWIPFQLRWEFPQTQRDGTICVHPQLKSVDARSTSARKLMVRVNVSLLGEAMEPMEAELNTPETVPEDIQLLKATYPVELPRESGEKLIPIDEELPPPNTGSEMERILRYGLVPRVLEQKVMAGRLVFRGKCGLHMLYAAQDGSVHTWDAEIPFSQYADLDRDYGSAAAASVFPIVTNLELLLDDERRLQLKCSIAAQYRIYDRFIAEIVEDAYSVLRPLKIQTERLILPIRLDQQEEMLQLSGQWNGQIAKIVDISCCVDHPSVQQEGDIAQLAVPMQLQMLYYDTEGSLQSACVRCDQTAGISSDSSNQVNTYVQTEGYPQGTVMGESAQLSAQCKVLADVFSQNDLQMIGAIAAGEKAEADPARPSLILRRKEKASLWDIAKSCGSTVDAIRKANGIQEEPEENQLLLIPVL